MAPGEDTDSGMESQDNSLRESQGSLTTGSTTTKEGPEASSAGSRGSVASGEGAATAESATSAEVATRHPASEEFQPESKPAMDDPFSDEPDETVAERLWGLTEMFPESVRNVTHTVAVTTKASIKTFYGFSRSAFWVVFSSSIILFAPVIFEVERVQMEEAQRTQQKQMLLGPNTAASGGGMPLMPPMHR